MQNDNFWMEAIHWNTHGFMWAWSLWLFTGDEWYYTYALRQLAQVRKWFPRAKQEHKEAR